MWALITGNIGKLFGGLGALIATALTLYMSGKKSGASNVTIAAAKKNEEETNVRQEIDRTVARANNAAEQLRNEWSRD